MGTSDHDSEQQSGNGAEPREEAIRRRAYEISQGPDAGTQEENWARAERELSGEGGSGPQGGTTESVAGES